MAISGNLKRAARGEKYRAAKLLSIPILLCILIYVLFFGTPVKRTHVGPPKATVKEVGRHRVNPVLTQASPRLEVSKQIQWPKPNIAALVDFNPFQTESKMADGVVDAQGSLNSVGVGSGSLTSDPQTDAPQKMTHAEIERAITEQPVRYVFQSQRRQAIMLGEEVFEAGGLLGNGLRVHHIDRKHLVISRESPVNPTDTINMKTHAAPVRIQNFSPKEDK